MRNPTPAPQTATEFRCTRPDLYAGSRAERDMTHTEREGTIVTAASAMEAAKVMQRRHPGDSTFTVSDATGLVSTFSLNYDRVLRLTTRVAA